MGLSDIIISKIQSEGPISFHTFMDLCLYHPDYGYYTTAGDKIGRDGDFITSSSLTPAFGATIGKQMEEIWHILGKKDFTIVEYGAGQGLLCHDMLEYLKENSRLYDHIRYCIIEKRKDAPIKWMSDKVHCYRTIDDIPWPIDCIFSNELIDNLPVHQVVMEDALMEVYIDYDQEFKELLRPAPSSLQHYFHQLHVTLPKGYRTEINLDAINWIRNASSHLKKGFIITIDYGALSEELYKPRHHCGSVLCYYKHQVSDDYFCNIGQQDITAHVNFSALQHWGALAGLNTNGITSLSCFLQALGFKALLRTANERQQKNILQLAQEESYISFTLLIDMGSKYQVLIQSKNISDAELTGLQFNR
ncbi:MAG: SAM-dependent methyltransferase [Chitinophaga sp.]|uniref:class I SAM-dependent methyltransferase n=1 Tax=Chitinophaga sp. TaxID=1869181 RepID=UPI0025BA1A42|nr:SAM-dependent methyltransferase [Chitinophaga sp.]MBV8251530.1 SAM-dependent methyltransferase [Chitinophaga sp.]